MFQWRKCLPPGFSVVTVSPGYKIGFKILCLPSSVKVFASTYEFSTFHKKSCRPKFYEIFEEDSGTHGLDFVIKEPLKVFPKMWRSSVLFTVRHTGAPLSARHAHLFSSVVGAAS